MPASLALLWGALALAAPEPPPRVEPRAPAGIDVALGASALVYQSVFSMGAASALEASAEGQVHAAWRWTAGARLELGTSRPEGFARLSASPAFGPWSPAVGLELGLTARGRLEADPGVLQETREASTRDAGPLYVAVHGAPLRFRLFDRWRLSVLEVQVGTHALHLGRTMRLQLGLASLGVSL